MPTRPASSSRASPAIIADTARAMGTDTTPVLVTHRLPSSSLAILRDAAEIEIPDTPLDPPSLRDAVRGRSALVTLLTDRVDAALLDAAGPSLKIVANVAVG